MIRNIQTIVRPVLVSGEAGDGEGVLLGVAAGAPGALLTVQLLQLRGRVRTVFIHYNVSTAPDSVPGELLRHP